MKAESRNRKIIRIGGSTGLTLPPTFLRKNNLKVGDVVGLTIDDVIVVVVPKMPRESGEDVSVADK